MTSGYTNKKSHFKRSDQISSFKKQGRFSLLMEQWLCIYRSFDEICKTFIYIYIFWIIKTNSCKKLQILFQNQRLGCFPPERVLSNSFKTKPCHPEHTPSDALEQKRSFLQIQHQQPPLTLPNAIKGGFKQALSFKLKRSVCLSSFLVTFLPFFLRSACLPVPFSLASSLILYKRSFHLIQHWESSDDENYRKVHEKRVALIPAALLFSIVNSHLKNSVQTALERFGWFGWCQLLHTPQVTVRELWEEKSLELLLEWVERSVGWFFWPSCPPLPDQHSWVYWFTGAPRTD